MAEVLEDEMETEMDTFFVLRRKSDGLFVGDSRMTIALCDALPILPLSEDEDIKEALAAVGETDCAAFEWVQVDARYDLTAIASLDVYMNFWDER